MRRIHIFVISLTLLCGQAYSAERSEKEIIQEAAKVLRMPVASTGFGQQQGLKVVKRMPMLSVVEANGAGYALVSNDDRLPAVMGYSQKGSFDPEDLPCNLCWYLQALDESLQAQLETSTEVTSDIRPGADVKPYVEPLIETDWYQTAPFNDWLPTYTDEHGVTRHFFTGCGQTAVAQVMYYYKYPVKAHGQVTYSYDIYEDGHWTEISCDLDTMNFDWDHIAAIYNNQRSTDEKENNEVARLFKAVCFALRSQYRPDGTTGYSATRGLAQHFGYSADCRMMYRSDYSDRLWMSIIFEELSCGHPCLYQGASPDPEVVSSHAFILDGYDSDGLVHINWGWGKVRTYDGYFSIDQLQPNQTTRDYSASQAMSAYIRPAGVPLSMMELTVDTPGSLATLLEDYPLKTRLKISGLLNADDLQALRRLGQQVRDEDSLIVRELTHLDLSEATLPEDTLPASAFESCPALLSVVLPTSLKAIGDEAFLSCNRLTHIIMPSSLRKIGAYAFMNCTNLTDIVIPRGVKAIGEGAFAACIRNDAFSVEAGSRHFAAPDGLLTNSTENRLVCFPANRTTAVIPASVDTIGRQAFRYCTNLKELHIPGTVKVVEDFAFLNCLNLENVTIDEGVCRILNGAFYNCDSLTSIHLPATIDSIGRRLFPYCDKMERVTMASGNPNFRVENNCLLSHDGRQLVQAMLTEAETVGIPASVEILDEFALYWMNITHLTLPATLHKLDRQSIYSCKQLEQIDIEEGLEEIDSYAFNSCSALNEIHLPASLKSLGYGIFINCTALHQADISDASPLFSSDDNMLFSKDGATLVQQLTDDKEEYVVPPTVTTIGHGCFRFLTNLHSLTIPTTVTSIGNYVLYGCKAVTDVYCHHITPLRLNQYVFALTDLSQTTLHVLEDCAGKYGEAQGWKEFGHIVEDLPNNIAPTISPYPTTSPLYDLQGFPTLHPLRKHIYIRGGKKVMVR